jgi:hypothetical protein
MDTSSLVPPEVATSPLSLDIYQLPRRPAPYQYPDEAVTILEEVSITAKPIVETKKNVFADYEVTGNWMRENNMVSVLDGIQRRVPGMRVLVTAGGKFILFGGPNSFGGFKTMEPLVLIDNVVVNDMTGGPADQIELLHPSQIERVEVTKFGGGAAYGARGGNGVIAIFTSRGSTGPSPTGLTDFDKSLGVPLSVKRFSVGSAFRSPDYSTSSRDGSTFDNRSTIYWNPDLSLDGKEPTTFSFYAADLTTDYYIVVEGVDASGAPVRAEKLIRVEDSDQSVNSEVK